MSENGEFDAKGTGNELGEMLIYAMLEEMLGARKLMSRVEIDSNPLSNGYVSGCTSCPNRWIDTFLPRLVASV